MAGHVGRNRAADRAPEQVEIAQDIEDLMARKLIRKTQIGVDDLFVVDQNAIVELAAADEACVLQLLDISQKSERSRRINLILEYLRSVRSVRVLLRPDRFRIAQNVTHGKPLRRIDSNIFTGFIPHGKRARNNDRRSGYVL